MANVDPALWAESEQEARTGLESSWLGGMHKSLSNYYQDGQFEQTLQNLTVKIYNRKVEEHNRRVRGY